MSSPSSSDHLPPLTETPIRLLGDGAADAVFAGIELPRPWSRTRIRNHSKIDCRKTRKRRTASRESIDRHTPLKTGIMRPLAPEVSSSIGLQLLSISIDDRDSSGEWAKKPSLVKVFAGRN
ncbi:hypothetical protein HPP92_004018 [Vanilla planifolia]|uniref:Uncharacterized protein n=1 Tax=Vanilla planifolia TaxID=51239 RepID=A0A835VHR8_VANPL|nr:hypothetical protein HPP92_004018 [Vanilla planifolia]